MKYLLSSIVLTASAFADTGAIESKPTETSIWFSVGMIGFGLLSFVPWVYLTIKEKQRKKID
jgi:hypothetical protein